MEASQSNGSDGGPKEEKEESGQGDMVGLALLPVAQEWGI
jgi:hypothetical protein